jgi:hypothetical protein
MIRSLSALAALISLAFVACSSDDTEPGSTSDAGGFQLSDQAADEERFELSPNRIDFAEVEVGDDDLVAVTLRNSSTSRLLISEIGIFQTDDSVAFANLFLGQMIDVCSWADTDGDRRTFESLREPLTIIPGGEFELLVQYRPSGALLGCLDLAPAPCGFLRVRGESTTSEVPIFIPREL